MCTENCTIQYVVSNLVKESPEFYATYKLINVKNHDIYSDNFTLSVVNLSRIDLATEEDKRYQIDYWARLFKATTWEKIHMLASENKDIKEASDTIFQLSADEQIRERCFAREEYYREIRTFKRIIAEKDALIEKTIAEKDANIRKLQLEIERLQKKAGD